MPVASLKFKTPRVTQIQDPGELPGRQFTLTIHNRVLQNAYNVATGGEFEIHYLLVTLKHDAADDASLATRQALRRLEGADPDADPSDVSVGNHSDGPHFIRVDLVEADEGDPKYKKIVSGSLDPAGEGDPGVVAISKVVDRSLVSAVETGAFDIRIILTEEPKEFLAEHIRVVNGSASDPVHLLPIPVAVTNENLTRIPPADVPVGTDITLDTDGPHQRNRVELCKFSGAHTAGTFGTEGLPEPTGRDNAYHLYAVTIDTERRCQWFRDGLGQQL